MSEEFLAAGAGMLKPGGILHYKTDHGEYFEQTVKLVQNVPELVLYRLSRDFHREFEDCNNVESEFEKLFKYKHLPVHFLEARRR